MHQCHLNTITRLTCLDRYLRAMCVTRPFLAARACIVTAPHCNIDVPPEDHEAEVCVSSHNRSADGTSLGFRLHSRALCARARPVFQEPCPNDDVKIPVHLPHDEQAGLCSVYYQLKAACTTHVVVLCTLIHVGCMKG